MIKEIELKATHARLHAWYQTHGRRALPWRNNADPYAIYISEIMLQQTQVKTVLERYYFPFLARFPTLTHLAEAKQEEVLKAWQGLGYYSRAVNIHKTATLTHPALPKTVEGLLELPGIGRNTAHAIAAFGYHIPVPVMEANVKRVIYRIFARKEANDRALWEMGFMLQDSSNPFDYNQAMMDIGALICTRTNPQCPRCPLSMICQGKEQPEHYPAKKQKKAVPTLHKIIILFEDKNGRFHITPRTSRFLFGLYGFAEYDKDAPLLFNGTVYERDRMERLGHITQSYSHFTLEAECYRQKLDLTGNIEQWKTPQEILKLPLSRADSKALFFL